MIDVAIIEIIMHILIFNSFNQQFNLQIKLVGISIKCLPENQKALSDKINFNR